MLHKYGLVLKLHQQFLSLLLEMNGIMNGIILVLKTELRLFSIYFQYLSHKECLTVGSTSI